MGNFVPNPALERRLRESAEMRAAMRRSAEAAVEEAQRLAPVDTGEYRNSIKVVDTGSGVRIVADDDKASYIEFGTEDTPAFAPLRRGTEAAGLKRGRAR